MISISSLNKIHKKGVFGDHQNKDQNSLTIISEVKDLKIIQIAHYRKSTLNISSISLDNLKFPDKTMQVNSNDLTRILWNGPNNWIVASKNKNILDVIREQCDEKNFAVTDLSHSRSIIEIQGINAKEILKKGCPINFNEFRLNNCANSVFHGITITIDMISDKPEAFRVFSLRSFGESFYHDVVDAALEFGYKGV